MQIIVAALAYLGPFLLAIVGSLAGRVMLAIGLGVVTYTGLDAVIGGLTSAAISGLGSGGEGAGFVVQASGFAEAVTIISSGYTTRIAITSLKKLTFVGGGS